MANEISDQVNLRFNNWKSDFPLLSSNATSKKLIYLDSAASAQKPQIVIDSMKSFYESEYANIHRGVYELSEKATIAYEGARKSVSEFIGASKVEEIVFTKGATESINLVASSWGAQNLTSDDEILITTMEHHANIVPWHLLHKRTGVKIKAVNIDENGELDIDHFHQLLTKKTKLVSITQTSNALGVNTPLSEIIDTAHSLNALVLVDGCQGIVHKRVDLQQLDADFYVFSGHKLYGPSGIGVLYGKYDILESMQPYQGGGDMIVTVTTNDSTYAKPPYRFEAGTPPIASAVGLAEAIKYISNIGMESIALHEHSLLKYASKSLQDANIVKLFSPIDDKAAIISFNFDDVHPHDVGTILDNEGIAVRAGHHCAQPTMSHFGVSGTVRASFGLYNDFNDIDALISGLHKVKEIFK